MNKISATLIALLTLAVSTPAMSKGFQPYSAHVVFDGQSVPKSIKNLHIIVHEDPWISFNGRARGPNHVNQGWSFRLGRIQLANINQYEEVPTMHLRHLLVSLAEKKHDSYTWELAERVRLKGKKGFQKAAFVEPLPPGNISPMHNIFGYAPIGHSVDRMPSNWSNGAKILTKVVVGIKNWTGFATLRSIPLRLVH